MLIGLLFCCPANADEAFSDKGWENAYSRRNFRLGITLEEFRHTSFPDDVDAIKTVIPAEQVYAVCNQEGLSGYAGLDLIADYGDKGVKVLKCAHYYNTSYGSVNRAMMKMGDNWRFHTIFYFIQPEGTEDFLLFKIVSEPMAAGYSEIRNMLSSGLGKKPSIKSEAVQNGFGARFVNQLATWDNGVSRITLEQYHLNLDDGRLTYTLKPLAKIYEQRKQKAKAPQPGSL